MANAGPSQTAPSATGSATVTLSAAGSADPEGDVLTYVWTENGSQIATGVSPAVVLAAARTLSP